MLMSNILFEIVDNKFEDFQINIICVKQRHSHAFEIGGHKLKKLLWDLLGFKD